MSLWELGAFGKKKATPVSFLFIQKKTTERKPGLELGFLRGKKTTQFESALISKKTVALKSGETSTGVLF